MDDVVVFHFRQNNHLGDKRYVSILFSQVLRAVVCGGHCRSYRMTVSPLSTRSDGAVVRDIEVGEGAFRLAVCWTKDGVRSRCYNQQTSAWHSFADNANIG